MRDFLSFRLAVQQGKVNPKRYPRIRREMDAINERFPRVIYVTTCTRCGQAPADDLCEECVGALRRIWPDPQFARELEQETADEAMRLSLGMGE